MERLERSVQQERYAKVYWYDRVQKYDRPQREHRAKARELGVGRHGSIDPYSLIHVYAKPLLRNDRTGM